MRARARAPAGAAAAAAGRPAGAAGGAPQLCGCAGTVANARCYEMELAQNLSARVEEAIRQVLGGAADELDGPSFDALAFVNKKFPDERSLEGLDAAIAGYDEEIRMLDASILETVREQSTAGSLAAKDIADAKDSIGDLQGKIIEIKKKAEASEQMVADICSDIRQLDVAKRHLTGTIQSLHRLKTLVSAVEQVKVHVAARNYFEAAPLFDCAVQLLLQFSDYLHVPKIKELSHAVDAIRGDLRAKVTDDFELLLDTVTPAGLPGSAAAQGGGGEGGFDPSAPRDLREDNIKTLEGACDAVDALGSSVRKDILRSFIRKQLKPYIMLFRQGLGGPGDTLHPGVEQRYAWFRAAQAAVDERYGRVLPKRWRVEHRIAIEFCEGTRTDVERLLSQYEPPSSVPAEDLLKALLKTHNFEKDLVKRFEGADFKRDVHAATVADGGVTAPAARGGGGGGSSDEEEFDASAALRNDKGEVVDPGTAEGIRLKHKARLAWEERRAKEAERRAQRAEQRAYIASLGGWERGKSGGAPPAHAVGQASLAEELAALPRFVPAPQKGVISAAFTPYLSAYVAHERARFDTIVAQTTAEDMGKTDSGTAAGSTVSTLASAAALFGAAKNAVGRCVQLNTGQTLFDLFDQVRLALEAYAAKLQARLPVPLKPGDPRASAAFGVGLSGDTYHVGEGEALAMVDALCLIFNTAGA